MREIVTRVVNPAGMHARPLHAICQMANGFESEVMLFTEAGSASAKSILGIAMIAVSAGGEVTISADGADEDEAAEAIAALFEQGFGEG